VFVALPKTLQTETRLKTHGRHQLTSLKLSGLTRDCLLFLITLHLLS
jgi:hypothetical protein